MSGIISSKQLNLYIKESALCGRGVFSSTPIQAGAIIECCPLIVYTKADLELIKYTNLYNYYSLPAAGSEPAALPLGYGSVYNHKSPSNAECLFDLKNRTMLVTAVSFINSNEEVTINYNGKYNDETPVAFKLKDEIYEFSVNLC